MKVEEVRNIGVIGAGLMGHEIDSGVLKSAPERIGTYGRCWKWAWLETTEVIKGLNREKKK